MSLAPNDAGIEDKYREECSVNRKPPSTPLTKLKEIIIITNIHCRAGGTAKNRGRCTAGPRRGEGGGRRLSLENEVSSQPYLSPKYSSPVSDSLTSPKGSHPVYNLSLHNPFTVSKVAQKSCQQKREMPNKFCIGTFLASTNFVEPSSSNTLPRIQINKFP